MDLDAVSIPDYAMYRDCMKVFNSTQSAAGGISTRRTPVAPILSSRGCPFKCSFCAAPVTTGQKMRYRSPENVLREIDMLVFDYGVKEIVFQDDEMYANKERARKIIQGIKERSYDLVWKNTNLASWRMDYDLIKLMKESGCYQITISPESGNPRVLREIIHKPAKMDNAREVVMWCKELGIETLADFVIGFPGETWDEIRDTASFAEELDADAVKFAVATPFPGTELYEVAVAKGLFPANYDFYTDHYLGFANPTLETEHWSRQDLKMLRVLEWDRINFKTPEKKTRYAKANGLTLEEVEKFRRETRRNLGVYFLDQAQGERHSDDCEDGQVDRDETKWESIQRVAASEAAIALLGGTAHEMI
jgi:anaerobic magnesium-protoporphyrin IX monomethyl ester cyclase